MHTRLMGLETEYGVIFQESSRRVIVDTNMVVARICQFPGLAEHMTFLANGARLYADCGHTEYATPEYSNPYDVLVADRAGEHIIASLATNAKSALKDIGVKSVRHFKNSTDSKGHFFGCHENFLSDATTSPALLETVLGPFLLTRSIWSGAGQFDEHNSRFLLSQRLEAFESVVGGFSTSRRPLIQIKDEPLADQTRFQRIHVLAGDANLAEQVTWLKLAVTSLMLRVVEEDDSSFPAMSPQDFRAAADSTNASLSGRAVWRTESGRLVCALDVQEACWEKVSSLLSRAGGTTWEFEALELWGVMLDRLARLGPSGLAFYTDWATKLELMERVTTRSSSKTAKLAWVDLMYHELEVGLARRLEQPKKSSHPSSSNQSPSPSSSSPSPSRLSSSSLARMSLPLDVARAKTQALKANRAHVRGEFVRRTAQLPYDVWVAWDRFRLDSNVYKECRDPFNGDVASMLFWLEDTLADIEDRPPVEPSL